MARKRMIDPQIWESAYDKGWTPDDFTVMIAAISAADDEGRGRISQIKRNVSEMFSDRKLKKVLENLQDSVRIYDKIYYFLPNFLEYQTINRPKGSKIPAPNENLTINKNNDLPENNHGMNHGMNHENGETSEVKLSEVKLSKKEVKLSEGNSLTFFSEDHFEKIKNLFVEHTRISDPNRTTHIEPILSFFSQIPEKMTEKDVEDCIKKTFSALKPGNGVRIDLLCTNIQQNITIKHEQILNKIKKNELNEVKNIMDGTQKEQAAADEAFKKKKLSEYKSFYEQNSEKFTIKEKTQLLEFFKKGNWMLAGEIIEPKIKELKETKND